MLTEIDNLSVNTEDKIIEAVVTNDALSISYTILNINKDQWLEGYNLDVAKFIEKTYTGAWYLSWSHAWRLLKIHHPNLIVYWERDKEGRFYFDSRNPYVLAYLYDLDSKARSLPVYFPVMNEKNRGVEGIPSGNLLNKSLRRAAVKAIAEVTGIGLRLWTGEDIDDSEKSKYIAKIKSLDELYLQLAGEKSEEAANAHLGLSEQELINLGKTLSSKIESLKQAISS